MNITNNCTANNKCTRCGQCCVDFVFISDAEIAMIKQYLRAHPEVKEEWDSMFGNNVYLLCPFFNKRKGKCNIYKVRPKICRLFKCNQSVDSVEKMKATFHAPKYHNVEDLLSWHLIFFDNPTQQLAVISKMGNKKL